MATTTTTRATTRTRARKARGLDSGDQSGQATRANPAITYSPPALPALHVPLVRALELAVLAIAIAVVLAARPSLLIAPTMKLVRSDVQLTALCCC